MLILAVIVNIDFPLHIYMTVIKLVIFQSNISLTVDIH